MYLNQKEVVAIVEEGATILSKLHGELATYVIPGNSTLFLDQLAETYIKDHGAKPSFKGYKAYPNTLCTSVNSQVVHGIPKKEPLEEGDIVSIDCGVYCKGYHSDAAFTHPVGNVSQELLNLLRETKAALYRGIEEATKENRMGNVGYAIQKHIENHGYSIIKDYGGHGIGKELHESPYIPNFGAIGKGKKIKEGMILAIEPIAALGKGTLTYINDWEVHTTDHSPVAHFEHTIAIVDGKPKVLTTYDYIMTKK